MKNHKIFFIWNGWIGKMIKGKKAIEIDAINQLIKLFETADPKKDYQIFCFVNRSGKIKLSKKERNINELRDDVKRIESSIKKVEKDIIKKEKELLLPKDPAEKENVRKIVQETKKV